ARTRRPRRRMHLARLHHATRLVRSRPPSRMGTRRRNRPRERGTHVPPPSPKVRPRRLGTPTRTRNALPHPARLARPPADAPPRRSLRTRRLIPARPRRLPRRHTAAPSHRHRRAVTQTRRHTDTDAPSHRRTVTPPRRLTTVTAQLRAESPATAPPPRAPWPPRAAAGHSRAPPSSGAA